MLYKFVYYIPSKKYRKVFNKYIFESYIFYSVKRL